MTQKTRLFRRVYKREMPRDRIELSTPGFSDQCSTTELPRHYRYIIAKYNGFEKDCFLRLFTGPQKRESRRVVLIFFSHLLYIFRQGFPVLGFLLQAHLLPCITLATFG